MSLFLIKIVLKLKNSMEKRTSIVCSTVCTGLVAAVLLLIVASRGALSLVRLPVRPQDCRLWAPKGVYDPRRQH